MLRNVKLTAIMIVGLLMVVISSSAQASLTMDLDPLTTTVGIDQEFTMDLVLNNPGLVEFDTLQAWVEFDPAYLQVKDTDSGNWITTGTNILDGPYHTTFPFIFHMNNEVDNSAGDIQYNEGLLSSTIKSSGTFAQITFKALDLTSSTPVSLRTDGTAVKNTAVLSGGENKLDAVSGSTVTVIPEPSSLILLGTGLMGLLGVGRFRRKRNDSI